MFAHIVSFNLHIRPYDIGAMRLLYAKETKSQRDNTWA